MKEIKDYLHLYLGCDGIVIVNYSVTPELKTREVSCKLKGVVDDVVYVQCYDVDGIKWDNIDSFSSKTFKPILRPLSDMSDEEMKQCVLVKYNMRNTLKTTNLIGNKIQWTASGFIPDGEIDLLNASSEIFRFLLSKHFDLFGLIESGLAIDATKQLQTNS